MTRRTIDGDEVDTVRRGTRPTRAGVAATIKRRMRRRERREGRAETAMHDLTMTPNEAVAYLAANPRFAATVRTTARAVAERLKTDEDAL